MSTPKRYSSILLIGPPGVGKGTQGKMIGAIPGFFHLATGDMFRSLDKESEIGLEFTRYSSQGLLVPDFLTVRLWRQHVDQLIARELYSPTSDILLLDGIPRSQPQAETMRDYIDPCMIIHLVCENIDEMVRRMQKRATEQGRPDDADESVIRKRFEVYAEQTAPVLACYDQEIIYDIDALGTQAEVLLRILSKIVPAIANPCFDRQK
ncbi:MAG TPA: nucleoside monophosphate kinase [Phycisphaerales bacterium]|nr:nucleoside monophosphate kinase [Phycisphaerales bacterium]HIB50956.1 nucleoside monophosphate kinase [Phycisphaerales bacterium]HIN84048.1 nucleoside monophosphate kinase [Phycisphaerales bacterium]HIO20103.1 nucleoside monophosphate kinase [Phycisphaerales bacterium]